jgi:hypothetical protein
MTGHVQFIECVDVVIGLDLALLFAYFESETGFTDSRFEAAVNREFDFACDNDVKGCAERRQHEAEHADVPRGQLQPGSAQ